MIDGKLSLHLSSALTLNFRHTLTEKNKMSMNLPREQKRSADVCFVIFSSKSRGKIRAKIRSDQVCSPTPQYLPVKYEVLHIMS